MTKSVSDQDMQDAIEESMKDEASALAANTMLGDLMAMFVENFKAAPKSWAEMSEESQKSYIERVEQGCTWAIEKCVDIIAGNGMVSLSATVDSVTFKNGVSAKLTIPKGTLNVMELAEANGEQVKIIIIDSEQYTGNKDTAPEAEANQRDLLLDDEPDSLYQEALIFVQDSGKVSISSVQRKLRIGYNRAARMIDRMENDGYISEMQKNGSRLILAEIVSGQKGGDKKEDLTLKKEDIKS